MCTVTFSPTVDGVIITSNRDENYKRGITILPLEYIHGEKILKYPKDKKSDGTWIALTKDKVLGVLLNGAFVNHERKNKYKHSRGLLIPSILQNKNYDASIDQYDFSGIEPFTLVVYDGNKLTEYRWDEHVLFKLELDVSVPHFWCSTTLYSTEISKKNANAFKNLYKNNITQSDLLHFHQACKYELQLPIKSKQNGIRTVSITQAIIKKDYAALEYHDLIECKMV